jgi:hypothetical protein
MRISNLKPLATILALTLLPPTLRPLKAEENMQIQKVVPMNNKTKSPKQPFGDPFGSELYIEGKTNVALDARSQAAQAIEDEEKAKVLQQEIDRSIRADISTGQPVTVLIAPEHFTQLTILKDNEIVYPRRAFTGQPNLVIIDKKENSPYLYLAASAMVEGQTTNLFIETDEDGKIQTYVINLLVTEPKNIRAQVAVNLVDDRTPPIRGGAGSNLKWEEEILNQTGSTTGDLPRSSITGVKKFSTNEVRKYFNTMIEMAVNYPEAKKIEKETGRTIYRDTDIQIFPGGINSYIDPIENCTWYVNQAWYFPKYDAILLDVSLENKTQVTSAWDYSQIKWQANQSSKQFLSTAASPLSMQTPPNKTNKIWYLIQGNRLDPRAEFSPVFPRAEKRGGPPINKPQASTSPENTAAKQSK